MTTHESTLQLDAEGDEQSIVDTELSVTLPVEETQLTAEDKDDNVQLVTPPVEDAKPTPMPWKQIVVVFTIFICDIFAFTVLSPVVGFMVVDFGLVDDGDERKIGNYAGFIISAYPLSQFFFAFMWGYLSDKYGRRPILIIGVAGSAVCSLLFGFSTNIYWAVAVRAMLGALNGNNGIFKTYVGEITDKSNQARAFSMIGLSFGIGNVFGPIISGFAARPHIQYPSVFENLRNSGLTFIADLFSNYPYLFVNIIVFGVNLVGLVLAVLFLKETNKKVLQRKANLENPAPIELVEVTPVVEEKTQEQEMEEQRIAEEKENKFNTMIRVTLRSREYVVKYPTWWPRNEILRNRPPLTCCTLQTMGAVCNQAFMAAVPIWMMLSVEHKGLNFGTQELGILGAISGVTMFLYQLLLCPVVLDKLGILNSARVACVIMALTYPFYPEMTYIVNTKWLLWTVLIVTSTLRIASMQTVMTGCNIMINNSVTPENMGKLNGIALSINSLGRAFGPVAATAIFSASSFGTVPPFDVHLIFVLISIGLIGMVGLTIGLPQSLNAPRKKK